MSAVADAAALLSRERALRIERACWGLLGTGLDLAVSESVESATVDGCVELRLVLEMWPVMPGDVPPGGTQVVYRVSQIAHGTA